MLKYHDTQFLDLSIPELQEKIFSKKITVSELITLHIGQIQKVNPKINALTYDFFDSALVKAKELDLKHKNSQWDKKLLPLFGIPFSMKGSFAYAGAPWDVGCRYRKEVKAVETAKVVQLLETNGAICLGRTNVPEASTWVETDNKIHGRTLNPFDIRRTPGGSSGGEAALIASRGSVFGIGTDFSGSVRIPAAFCGISAHKPSPGLISNHGQWPLPLGELDELSVVGPLARNIQDLIILLEVLSEGKFKKSRVDSISDQFLADLKIFYYFENGESSVSNEIMSAMKKALSQLTQLGFVPQQWRPSLLSQSSFIWLSSLIAAADSSFYEILASARPDGQKQVSLIKESALWCFEQGAYLIGKSGLKLPKKWKERIQSNHLFPVLFEMWLERVLRSLPKRWFESLHQKRNQLQLEFVEKLGNQGVIVAPVYRDVAPFHHFLKRCPQGIEYSGIYNVLKMPATSVTVGQTQDGIPLSVQVIANLGNDHLALKVASFIEKKLRPGVLEVSGEGPAFSAPLGLVNC